VPIGGDRTGADHPELIQVLGNDAQRLAGRKERGHGRIYGGVARIVGMGVAQENIGVEDDHRCDASRSRYMLSRLSSMTWPGG
jgi:hypothetical protein